jgi:hypothetical protein
MSPNGIHSTAFIRDGCDLTKTLRGNFYSNATSGFIIDFGERAGIPCFDDGKKLFCEHRMLFSACWNELLPNRKGAMRAPSRKFEVLPIQSVPRNLSFWNVF